MADIKIKDLPIQAAPTLTDFAVTDNTAGTATEKTTWQKILDLFGVQFAFIKNGNAFGIGVKLGITDNFQLDIIQNNINVITINTSQQAIVNTKLGVGATPTVFEHVSVAGAIKGTSLRASGDEGGVGAQTTLTNITVNAGVPTGAIKLEATLSTNNDKWIKIYIGTTAYLIPAWLLPPV